MTIALRVIDRSRIHTIQTMCNEYGFKLWEILALSMKGWSAALDYTNSGQGEHNAWEGGGIKRIKKSPPKGLLLAWDFMKWPAPETSSGSPVLWWSRLRTERSQTFLQDLLNSGMPSKEGLSGSSVFSSLTDRHRAGCLKYCLEKPEKASPLQ